LRADPRYPKLLQSVGLPAHFHPATLHMRAHASSS
jgi:hypothetical protein